MVEGSRRVAVVTGSSRGIGAATAVRLAADRHDVVVNYASREADAERVRQAIKASGGKAIAVRADVGDPAAVSALFDAAEAAFGPVSCLVNNAGAGEMQPLEAVDVGHADRVFRVQTIGPLLTTAEFARRFRGATGRVVNVSSGAARLAVPGLSVHSASKAALEALTRCHALELGPRGVTVNAVAPGFIMTETNEPVLNSQRERFLAATVLGRFGDPSDVASAIAFLCSDEASWITGQVHDVNGGTRFLP